MTERIGYRALLREHPDFLRLWLGDVVSFLGDWFNTIAVYTSVQAISNTGIAVALVLVCKTLPAFFVSPITGPIIDRFDRRSLLLVSDFARAACVAGLIASHHLQSLVGLYGFTAAMVAFTGLAFPTRNAVIPMLVTGRHLVVANALGGGTWSIMLAIGAAMGGVATAVLGVTASLAIDGVTFLGAAAIFARLPRLPAPASAGGNKATFIDGLRYLRRSRYVLALVALKPMLAMSSAAIVLIPLFGAGVFPDSAGPAYVGLLYAARGAGALVGSMLLRLWFSDTPRTLRRLIVFGYLLIAAAYTLLARADAYWLVALCYFVGAIGTGSIWVFSGTLVQAECDPRYLGRVSSLEFGLMTLVMATASWLIGAAVDWQLSPFDAIGLCAVAALPPAALWLGVLVTVRVRLRRGARARLSQAYAIAADEPHAMLRSRQYRYATAQKDDADPETPAEP